jgi:general secretion pathway protein E/type IV pilus assembly protein PilB
MKDRNIEEQTIVKTSLNEFKPLPEGNAQYPLEYIETNGVIKLKEDDDLIQIGLCDADNVALQENLRNFHKKDVRFFAIEKSELASYLGEKLSKVNGNKREVVLDEKILLDKLANDAPIVNLVNSIFIDAIREGASDIHIECFSENMTVRYRIDGVLQTVKTLEKERFPAISSRIKIMSNLNIMEKRLPQDGRITVHLDNDIVDLRVSIVPISNGESIVLRLFNKKRSPLSLKQLGLINKDMETFKKAAQFPNGLILVTGPTGSGKTTTLNAILEEVKDESLKIISIEDPIEYNTDGIAQIQTNEAIGLSFDSILRRVLRQDPNIIMVGEIRDAQTAELAIRAALTGHLVFSTLHTNDSISVITRLTNMGVESFLLAAVLRCSMAQRLVRRLCKCRHKVALHPAYKKLMASYGIKELEHMYEAKGCKDCHNSGYKGRVGIFELFTLDDMVEEMIIKAKREAEIREYLAKEHKMKSLLHAGLLMVSEGITTISEVERATLR